jgi:predicted nucleic-acid-binding Zn-ribbon protein
MGLFKRKPKEPQPVTVKGIQLKCPVCSNDRFHSKRVMLNTTMLTFLDLDWANREAQCFICSDCTHISWFYGK